LNPDQDLSIASVAPVPLFGAPNFRSLGGIKTSEGRKILESRLFRSQVLSKISESDIEYVSSLDIRLVCDLRTPQERERESNSQRPFSSELRTIASEYKDEISGAIPTNWAARLLEDNFDEHQAFDYMLTAYRAMPKALAPHISQLIEHAVRNEHPRVLIHCQAGKDRTGFVCALILWALGVPKESIFADYLESNRRLRNKNKSPDFLNKLFGPEVVPARAQRAEKVIRSVHPEFLNAAICEILKGYSSVESYLVEVAGLRGSTLTQFRHRFLSSSKN